MRGVETRIRDIRHRIFTEVARMAYHTEWPTDRRIEALPYDIMPGEVAENRQDIFLERAIVGERLRLAMGLPCRSAAEHAPLSDNIDAAHARPRCGTAGPSPDAGARLRSRVREKYPDGSLRPRPA